MKARVPITIGVAVIGAAWATAAWVLRPVPEVHVTTAQVTSGPVVRHIVASGTLQAVTSVQVGSQVSGTISKLGADFNSFVRKDEIIATLDPSLYDAALHQAQAARNQAAAAAAQSRADLDALQVAERDADTQLRRAQALAAAQLEVPADLDAAVIASRDAHAAVAGGEAKVHQADAAVVAADANVTQAQVNLDHTVIRSPIDGVVINRAVDVGQTLAASVQAPELFTIAADLRHLQVQVDVDESDIGGITAGEMSSFQVQSYPEETFQGTIAQVRLQPVAEQTIAATTVGTGSAAPVTTQVATVVAYTVVIDVANPDERLRPGMTAEVTLDGARRPNAIRVPNAAFSFRPSEEMFKAAGQSIDAMLAFKRDTTDGGVAHQVWRFSQGRFEPVVIDSGIADERWTEVVGGAVRPGDALVTAAVLADRRSGRP